MWRAAFAALFTVLLTTPLTAQAAGTVVGAFEVTGGVKDTDYSYDETEKVLTIKTATALTIKNADSTAATQDRIQVEAGVSADITLAGVKIELGIGSEPEYMNLAAFEILQDAEGNGSTGNVTITVADDTENTLKSGWNRAGIEKSGLVSDTLGTLTIKGGTKRTGHLLARGGVDAPGIGSQNGTAKITIENVILTANTVGGGEKKLNGIGDSCGGENSAKIVVRGGSVSATPINTSNALGGWRGNRATDGNEYGYISLLVIYNPDGKKVWIDGEEYYPANHADDAYLYAYLSQEGHSVRVGDEAEQVYYFSGESFERANQFSIQANDGKALVCGTDYTYIDDRLMVLTDRAVTISNCDSTEYTEHKLGVGKDVNADITLAGVKIRAEHGAAFFIEDDSAGNVTLRVAENTENHLHGWHGSEGILKAYDPDKITPQQVGTLTITGAGSLVVEGGSSGSGYHGNAGIGSDSGRDMANIVIDVTGFLKIYGNNGAPGIGSSSKSDGTTRNVVIRGGGTVSVIGNEAPAIRTEELQLSGGSIYLEKGLRYEGKTVENAVGKAVTPTDGEGKPVCLLVVENEDSLPVFIDGVSQVPIRHANFPDPYLFVYLPEGMHTVKVGDTEYEYICDAASGLATLVSNGMQITADDGSTLDYGKDYTYACYIVNPNNPSYNYYVLRILTAKPVTIRNTDPETQLMEQIQVAKDVSANITLDGVSLLMMVNAPFEIEAGSTGNVCLTIADDSKNSLEYYPAFLSSAGIQKNDGTAAQPGTLTIQGGAKGNGLLTVTGGAYSAGIGEGMVGTENLAGILSGAGLSQGSVGTSNIKILGGNIVTSGATGIGSASGTAKNIQILGGTVTTTAVALTTEETEVKASAISGISKASDLVIDGGSVKAVPANGIAFGKGETAVTPVDEDGNAVYLLELENAAGATLKVDGVSYPVKHGEEARLYLYLPAKTAQTPNRVTLGSVTTGYIYDEANGKWLRVAEIPAEDSTKFSYNGNTQHYGLTESDCYTVLGNDRVKAGMYSVMVEPERDVIWSDGTSGTKQYSFVISRTKPQISLAATYEFVDSVKMLAVTATTKNPYNERLTDIPQPTFSYRIGDGSETVFTGSFAVPENLAQGTKITITAMTVRDDNYEAGTQTLTVEVCAHANKQTVWTADGSAHWHVCPDCGEELDKAAHVSDGAADGKKCIICTHEIVEKPSVSSGDAGGSDAEQNPDVSGGDAGSEGSGSEDPGNDDQGSEDTGDEEEEEDDGDNNSVGGAGTFIPSQEAALAGNEISISTESGWNAVNELLRGLSQIFGRPQLSGENRNINLYAKGVSRIPGNVLQTLSGTKLTLAIQHRNGVALSVSGSALNSRNISGVQTLDLTVDTETRNIPWEVIREKHVSIYRQLTVRDTGKFAVPVNLHVNVGAGNAGRYANFYRYNEVLGKLEYCGSFRVKENGQAMTALQQGGNYLVTVTDTIPMERNGR